MAEDGADVGAVVVAMVKRLDQQNTDIDPLGSFLPFGDDACVAVGASRHLDQLVAADGSFLSEDRNARELVAHHEPAHTAAQPPEIAPLGANQVLEGRRDRSISAGRRQLKLPIAEISADIEQVQVRPAVVAKGFDQNRFQSASILNVGDEATFEQLYLMGAMAPVASP